jgi:hypothetical protein
MNPEGVKLFHFILSLIIYQMRIVLTYMFVFLLHHRQTVVKEMSNFDQRQLIADN